MISRIVLFIGALAGIAASGGCGSSGGGANATDTVVAAFYPIAFAAERIAGASASVRNLTPAGSEPHDLELSPGDARDVAAASLVLYLGDGFMPALDAAVAQRGGRSVDLLAGGSLVPGAGGDGESARDPHVWLDPLRYAAMVRTIGAALSDQGLGDDAAAERLAVQLEQLDAEIRRDLARCARREIVTSHAAFGYLAARYGLDQIPLDGVSPEAEPSPRTVARLVEDVRRSGATTVFFETLVSPRLAETVAREAGVRTAVLDPIEGLTPDQVAMGADYFSVMRRNVDELRKALGCTS